MTAIRTITSGPTKWDIMLSLFEEKKVTFTFEDGDTVSLIIEHLHNCHGAEYLQQAGEYVVDHPRDDGWLIAGRPVDSRAVREEVEYQIWIEYDAQPGTGIAVIQSEPEYSGMAKEIYLPFVWYVAMGIPVP